MRSQAAAPSSTSGADTSCQLLGLYLDQGPDTITAVFGPKPEGALQTAATSMRQLGGAARPGARRLGDGYLIRVPLENDAAHLWWIIKDDCFGPGQIQELVEASRRLRAGCGNEQGNAAPAFGQVLLSRLARLPRASRRRRVRQAINIIGEVTGWARIAAIEVRNSRPGAVHMLSPRADAKRASIKIFAAWMVGHQKTFLHGALGDPAEGGEPDGGPAIPLFCAEHDLLAFALALPKGDGLGLYVEGDIDRDAADFVVSTLGASIGPPRQVMPVRGRRLAILSMLACIAFWLAQPAPFEIGAPGEIRPARSQLVVVPHEARLVELNVHVGERISKNQVLARLIAPLLEEAEARATLDQLLEGLSADEALAAGDYARYQLAEQRRDIAALQVAQARRRLGELVLRAPEAGRVADLVSRAEIGALLAPGTVIAEVQDGKAVQVVLQVAPGDGPRLRAGMSGRLVVQGLIDRSYPIKVLENPVIERENDDSATLAVLATVKAPPSDDTLFKGLSAYARIDAGVEPRLLIWLRPVIDYIRLSLWQFFGLHL